jgi:hypothetical protein
MHTTLILLTMSKAMEHGFSSRGSWILKGTTNEAGEVNRDHKFKVIKDVFCLTVVHLDILEVRRGHFKKLGSVKTTSKLLESADEKEVGNHWQCFTYLVLFLSSPFGPITFSKICFPT